MTVESKLARMKALSIRQPYAEAIMRGTKTIEYRSRATRVRGRILIYASLSTASLSKAPRFDMTNDEAAALPRGVIIGSVELYDCEGDGEEWMLRDPQRLTTPIAPAMHPQPVWFYPFPTVDETPEELLEDTATLSKKSPSAAKSPRRGKGTLGESHLSDYAQGWNAIFGKSKRK